MPKTHGRTTPCSAVLVVSKATYVLPETEFREIDFERTKNGIFEKLIFTMPTREQLEYHVLEELSLQSTVATLYFFVLLFRPNFGKSCQRE